LPMDDLSAENHTDKRNSRTFYSDAIVIFTSG
jgi:hypothetical protein